MVIPAPSTRYQPDAVVGQRLASSGSTLSGRGVELRDCFLLEVDFEVKFFCAASFDLESNRQFIVFLGDWLFLRAVTISRAMSIVLYDGEAP